MLITLATFAALGLCIALSLVKGYNKSSGDGDDLRGHSKGLDDHGKELKEKVSGRKCPHCGKPI